MSDDCLATHYHDRHGPVHVRTHYFLAFDGDSSYIDCGSDASLDNIWTGKAATADCWAKARTPTTGEWEDFFCKYTNPAGWYFAVTEWAGEYYLVGYIGSSMVYAQSLITHTPGNVWHHYTMVYDDTGDRKIYLAVDGVWAAAYPTQFAATGIVRNDAAFNLLIGSDLVGEYLDGGIQWLRLSNNVRWMPGVDFTPPTMCAPPAVDANTIELWAMDEGSGATTAAEVNSPANDGTLTDCIWHRCT